MSEINMPYGNNSFSSDDLIVHIKASGRLYIIQGQTACILDKHPKQSSLDYWLRTNYADKPDTMQAVNKVVDDLLATGDFVLGKYPCPDGPGHRRCKGLKLKE